MIVYFGQLHYRSLIFESLKNVSKLNKQEVVREETLNINIEITFLPHLMKSLI